MSEAQKIPEPAPHVSAPPPDIEHVPESGVRPLPVAVAERPVHRIRWGAVIAGLILALATQLVIGLLGIAVGLTAVVNRAAGSLSTPLSVGAGIWMAISSLVALFVGGYTAARLSDTVRRGDGVFAGILTWATSMVLAFLVLGGGAGALVLGAFRLPTPAQIESPLDDEELFSLRLQGAEAARGAWLAFGGVLIALLASAAGGSAGAGGVLRKAPDDLERARRMKELDRETMRRQLG